MTLFRSSEGKNQKQNALCSFLQSSAGKKNLGYLHDHLLTDHVVSVLLLFSSLKSNCFECIERSRLIRKVSLLPELLETETKSRKM